VRAAVTTTAAGDAHPGPIGPLAALRGDEAGETPTRS
jgi:hypothetical protein